MTRRNAARIGKKVIYFKRQDADLIFTVTNLEFVVRRLLNSKVRSDTIVLEVKEQLKTFQHNKVQKIDYD